MSWRKPDPDLMDLFEQVMPDPQVAERRKMFGCPCCFVNGNMFAGVHQESLLLRLDEEGRRELLQLEGARLFEPFPGRKMREYVVLPREILEDRQKLASWVTKSFEYAASLEPKVKEAKSRQRPARSSTGARRR